MSDPRKPVITPDNADYARDVAYKHLAICIKYASKELGCTGASFVLIGIGMWSAEIAELDAAATSQMLAALSVIYDPKSNDTKKAHAERKRLAAVKKIFGSLDLVMADPAGQV